MVKKLYFFFRMFRPHTFRRSQRSGLRHYEILQKADLHYYVLVLPFLLALFVGMPCLFIPEGMSVALNPDREPLERLTMAGYALIGVMLPYGIYFIMRPIEIDGREKMDIQEEDLTFTTIFTIGSGVIELKNPAEDKILSIPDITNITIRDDEILEHHQVQNKKYSHGPTKHLKSFHDYHNARGLFDDIFIPRTFSVDVETADYVLTLTRSLPRRKAHALVQSIAKDMGLRLKKSPRQNSLYESSFEVVR